MGSLVRHIVINIYIEVFKKNTLSTFSLLPVKKWYQYVDDTFVSVNDSHWQQFLKHINQLDENIKFTEESCMENKLAFLDCLISEEVGGSFSNQCLPQGNAYRSVFVIWLMSPLRTKTEKCSETMGIPIVGIQSSQNKKSHNDRSIRCMGRVPTHWSLFHTCQNPLKKTGENFQTIWHTSVFQAWQQLEANSGTPEGQTRQELKVWTDIWYQVCWWRLPASFVGETKQALISDPKQHRRPSTNKAQVSAVYHEMNITVHQLKDSEVIILDREPKLLREFTRFTVTFQQKAGSSNCNVTVVVRPVISFNSTT